MKILVVTGGIGSGKSQVCRLLKERFRVPVYEADKRAKELYAEHPEILDTIESDLNAAVRNEEGEFVPKMLADIIFSDPSALLKVENILFPAMKRDFSEWAESKNVDLVAFESATILEKPQFSGFGDFVLLVDAPISLRLKRAAERDCAEIDRIKARMDAQKLMNRLSEGGVDERIDYVIKNDLTLADLAGKLTEFMGKYGLTKML